MTRMVTIFKYRKTKESGELCFGKVPDGDGIFHGFGVDYEDFGEGPGNFSTAIVERPSGHVINVRVELIKFKN